MESRHRMVGMVKQGLEVAYDDAIERVKNHDGRYHESSGSRVLYYIAGTICSRLFLSFLLHATSCIYNYQKRCLQFLPRLPLSLFPPRDPEVRSCTSFLPSQILSCLVLPCQALPCPAYVIGISPRRRCVLVSVENHIVPVLPRITTSHSYPVIAYLDHPRA